MEDGQPDIVLKEDHPRSIRTYLALNRPSHCRGKVKKNNFGGQN
jgi:hypothetical protein